MVDLWSAYNRHIAYVIGHIPESHTTRECIIGNKPAVTLGWLIEDYLRHEELVKSLHLGSKH